MCNVNIATGELLRYHVDLFLPGYIPVEITRTFKSGVRVAGIAGRGWRVNLLMTLRHEGNDLVLFDENGVETHLARAPDMGRSVFANTDAGMRAVYDDQEVILDRGDGRRYRFPAGANQLGQRPLASMEDRHANKVSFQYSLRGLPHALTDTLQRRLNFTFDERDRLIEIVLAPDSAAATVSPWRVRYTYDSANDLVAVEDAAGHATRFEYQDGLLVREIDRTGRSTFWAYDGQRRCIRTWRDGGTLYRRLDFDDVALQVKVTDALGYSTVYGLDENRNIVSKTDALGHVEQRTYDEGGNLLVSTGGIEPTLVTFWDRETKCLTEASSEGNVKKYHFDDHHRLIRTELGDGEEWRHEYDDRGDLVRLSGPGGVGWSMEFAPQGYVSRLRDSQQFSVYQHRDARGRVHRLTDDVGHIYRSEFDVLGGLTAITDPVGNTTRCAMDLLGRVTEIRDAEGGVRRCRYDNEGRVLEVVDELGRSRRYEYGAGDQPIREIDASGQVLSLEYDLEERLTAVIDWAGQTLTIAHDPLGRVTSITGFDGRVRTHSYEDHGDAVTHGYSDGTFVRFEGPRRTPSKKTFSDGSEIAYEWIGGLLHAATGPGGAISRAFDGRARPIREVQDGWALGMSFDTRDNLVGVSDEGGRSTQYDYDARRRVIAIRDSHFGEFRFSYDSRDLLIRLDYPNGLTTQFEYDRCDRMVRTALGSRDGESLLARRFEYDQADQLTSEILTRIGQEVSEVKRYEYDARGYLTTVLRNGEVDEWYRYDATGNIRSCHLFADSETEAGNRVVRAGAVRFGFDSRGRRIAKHDVTGDTFYEYDADNRLNRVRHADGSETRFRYDPVGRRLEKTHAGRSTRFHWLVDTVFKESREDGDSHYLFMPTTFFPIAMSRNGERTFVFFDQIASPRELISWGGEIVWSRDASAYGADRSPVNAQGVADCPIRFQGQYHDNESGLDYNYHRFYDPLLGRYLTPDPLGIYAGPNAYRYVPEPLTWIDPYGLFTATVFPRCDWNKKQMDDFNAKVDRYNAEIRKRQAKGEPGITISPCARSSQSASEAYKKCDDINGTPQKDSPDGKGKPTDCKDDIDHIIDKQMGGEDKCANFVPVNASVNRSLGSQMKREIAKAPGEALTLVEAKTKDDHCDDTTERTPACK
jgi:RHS repeat-associated protein